MASASQQREKGQLVWLVTGTSSGIGAQLVHAILARGDRVIATARNVEKVRHLGAAGATVLRLDVTDSAESIGKCVATAIEAHGHIDVLVNNAGYVSTGLIEDLSTADIQAQLDTNVLGTIKVTQALLPHFRQRRAGTCVFISSLSGWIGHPGCAPYAMSKFAVEAFAESLRAETSGFGIQTLVIEPGRFRTTLLSSSANLRTKASAIPDYVDFSRAMNAGLAAEDGKQPGDPVKLAHVVLDLVRGEGVAEGKEVPFRMLVGRDCVDEVRGKCEGVLGVVREWEGVWAGCDVVE